MQRRTLIKVTVLLLLAGAVAAIWFSPLRAYLTREHIRAFVEHLRGLWYGPLAFIAVFALGCVLALPASVFVVEPKKQGSPGMTQTPDGKLVKIARQQFVRLGQTRGDFVAITKGVQVGQELVSAGAFKLRNNAPIVVDNSVKPDAKLDPHPENR